MPSTSVVSGRIESQIRLRAEQQLRRRGLTASDAIRNTWTYIADTGDVPESALYSPGKKAQGGFELFLEARAAMPQGTPLDTMTSEDLKAVLADRG